MLVDRIFAAAAKEKQRLMTPLCANFSYDFARVMAELGGPSVNEELIRTYSYFLWKIDWFIDTFPMWKDNVHPSGQSRDGRDRRQRAALFRRIRP